MAQSALANGGCKVCLLWGAGTQMASWFYTMMHLLCLKQMLVATIHQQKFLDLTLNDSVIAAVHDIKDGFLEVHLQFIVCCIPCP
jgi:hypothetical protein